MKATSMCRCACRCMWVIRKKTHLVTPQESFMRQFRRLGGQLTASVVRPGAHAVQERAERGAQLAVLEWERDVIGQKAAVGTPEMVIEQLRAMKDTLSLTGVVAEFNAGELIPEDKIASSLAPVLRRGYARVQVTFALRRRRAKFTLASAIVL